MTTLALDRQIRMRVDPRLVTPEKAARRLGLTLTAFEHVRAQLETRGFPKPFPVIGHYALDAIDRWIDETAGLVSDDSPEAARAAMRKALANI
jgi:hypothetical protein